MKTLRELLGKPVLFHRVGWHGKDGPSPTGYDSRDPKIIAHQLHAMQELGGDGTGVIQLSYGLNSPFIAESALETCNQCNALGMPFALCMDPYAIKDQNGNLLPSPAKEAAMIAALKSPDMQFMLNSDSYLTGKPVLDFSTTVNKASILAAVPGITWLQNGPDFDWPRFPQMQNKTTLPCKYLQFYDGARIILPNGGKTFWDLDVSAGQYAQIVTWDDYFFGGKPYGEGTAVEPFASMLWGRI
jgi:hypothetical protein